MKNSEQKYELLLKFLRSELDDKESNKIKKMLNSDREFRNMYDVLKNYGADRLKGHLAELMPSLKQISINMFREYHKSERDRAVERGLPIFDSDVMPMPEGVRPSVTNSRRLKYKFKGMDLEMSLYPISLYSYEMIGQFSGVEGKTYQIELTGKKFRQTTETDELHMFTFARIPSDVYQINIIENKKILAVVDLEV